MSKQKVTVFNARKMRTMAIVTDAEFREQMKADFDKRTEGFVYRVSPYRHDQGTGGPVG